MDSRKRLSYLRLGGLWFQINKLPQVPEQTALAQTRGFLIRSRKCRIARALLHGVGEHGAQLEHDLQNRRTQRD